MTSTLKNKNRQVYNFKRALNEQQQAYFVGQFDNCVWIQLLCDLMQILCYEKPCWPVIQFHSLGLELLRCLICKLAKWQKNSEKQDITERMFLLRLAALYVSLSNDENCWKTERKNGMRECANVFYTIFNINATFNNISSCHDYSLLYPQCLERYETTSTVKILKFRTPENLL